MLIVLCKGYFCCDSFQDALMIRSHARRRVIKWGGDWRRERCELIVILFKPCIRQFVPLIMSLHLIGGNNFELRNHTIQKWNISHERNVGRQRVAKILQITYNAVTQSKWVEWLCSKFSLRVARDRERVRVCCLFVCISLHQVHKHRENVANSRD